MRLIIVRKPVSVPLSAWHLEPFVDDRRNTQEDSGGESDGEAAEERKGMHELQKCDGVKPICGPCRKHPKDDECEYTDGPGRSRTKVLEETVARLEARLHELEHPEETTPSVTLHDPYRSFPEVNHLAPQLFTKSPLLLIPERSPFNPSSPFSPTSTTSSLPSGRQWTTFSALEGRTESTGSSGSSTSPNRQYTGSPFLGTEEPPYLTIQNILSNFLPHAVEFGFFLNIDRFRNSALLHLSFGHHSRPSAAVLSAVYLWGVHLSQSEPLLAHEHVFLTRALQHTATGILGPHPSSALHTLQAEVLLAYYFFRTGRFLEAKLHTASAVSIALGCGFHKIRSTAYYPPSTIGLSSDTPISLAPPQDIIEEGERINSFWATLMLHKLISVALDPANVCGTLEAPGMQVDTPWPLDVNEYAEGLLLVDIRGSFTIRNFLTNVNSDPHGHHGHSLTALVVKASVLFHRATHLSGQWTPELQPREFQAFAATFQSINRLIDTFRSSLPAYSNLDPKETTTRSILLAHALADAATIKLHSIFSYADSASKHYCLTAAQNMMSFGGLNLRDLGHINPIMGTLWMIACHVFIDEISRVRSPQGVWPTTAPNPGEEELMEHLRAGMTALSLFSEDSAFMRYQLTKIQEAFSAI